MAYDKVIDSAQFEAAVTATANAIREKTGDAALIQWLADKGFSEAIAAIQAGGGGEGGVFATGEITPTSTAAYLDITHGLGKIPKFAIIFEATFTKPTEQGGVAYSYYLDGTTYRYAKYNGTSYNSQTHSHQIDKINTTAYMYGVWNAATNDTVRTGTTGTKNGYTAGKKYRWIVGA